MEATSRPTEAGEEPNFWLLTGFWWSVIPLVGWGIVLGLHYLHLRRIERAAADRRARIERRAATPKPAA